MSEFADSLTLQCEEVLFRAILNKRHLTDGQVQADAFVLRSVDEGKLSTYRKKLMTLAACKAVFRTCVGVVTLHVGHVRATGVDEGLNLDVIGDELPSDPIQGHASIINVPDPIANRVLAERVASLLRDQSRIAND
jgi:hypothetical protein